MLKLNIIGAGRVGRTLGLLWHQNKAVEIQDVLCRTMESATEATAVIGAGRATQSFSDLRPANVYVISVPDDRIAETATSLAKQFDLSNAIVFHVSGVLSSGSLRAAAGAGASIASVHPIKSFADPRLAAESFPGTWCGIEGDLRALDWLKPVFESVGAVTIDISTEQKAKYHAAVVMASNFLVGLAELARQTLVTAGVEPDKSMQMLAPLIRGTAENLSKMAPSQALTGPVARGDAATVETHLEALAELTEVAPLYIRHSQQLLQLSEQQGTPSDLLADVAAVLKKFEGS